MKGYKLFIRQGFTWRAFYVWAADENAAALTAKFHLVSGGAVD